MITIIKVKYPRSLTTGVGDMEVIGKHVISTYPKGLALVVSSNTLYPEGEFIVLDHVLRGKVPALGLVDDLVLSRWEKEEIERLATGGWLPVLIRVSTVGNRSADLEMDPDSIAEFLLRNSEALGKRLPVKQTKT